MKRGNKVVFGLFDTQIELENAIDIFKSAGFRAEDISVLMPRLGDPQTLAHEKATKAPEGVAVGGGTGLVIGGILGWLGAVATIPVFGLLAVAGPILSALAGAALGGTVGGLTGALVGFGIPEYEAKRFETFVKEGGILLSAHVDDKRWSDKAKKILESAGAHDIMISTEESKAPPKLPKEPMDQPRILN